MLLHVEKNDEQENCPFSLFRFDELGIEKKIGKSTEERKPSELENQMKVWMIDSVFFIFLWIGLVGGGKRAGNLLKKGIAKLAVIEELLRVVVLVGFWMEYYGVHRGTIKIKKERFLYRYWLGAETYSKGFPDLHGKAKIFWSWNLENHQHSFTKTICLVHTFSFTHTFHNLLLNWMRKENELIYKWRLILNLKHLFQMQSNFIKLKFE